MYKFKLQIALTVALSTLALLQGCATYGKCGIHGCPGDAEITARVEGLFKQHPDLEPPNLLSVQTLDQVVYLYGLVETDLQREAADDVALQAAGVARVVDSIGVINK
jgi:osmotically-inducible protein OsmY